MINLHVIFGNKIILHLTFKLVLIVKTSLTKFPGKQSKIPQDNLRQVQFVMIENKIV